jgi:hypothetical protein
VYEDPEEVADFLPVTFTVTAQVDAVQSVIDLLHGQQVQLRAQFASYYQVRVSLTFFFLRENKYGLFHQAYCH